MPSCSALRAYPGTRRGGIRKKKGNTMIRLFCTDVDGVMTDNKIYIGADGERFKCFNTRDGMALKNILPQNGIEPAVITGRESAIVRNRCEELGIRKMIINRNDKDQVIKELAEEMGCSLEEVSFIGDDLNDLAAMKIAGLTGCPADAVQEIRDEADYICRLKGGEGALREFAEWVVKQQVSNRDEIKF